MEKSEIKKIKNRFKCRLNLRNFIYRRDKRECAICKSNYRLEIDHILPISKFPEFAFDPTNLRILCKKCNIKKSDKY